MTLAGVIVCAAGGAVTTALVTAGDGDDRPRIGQHGTGMPAVPPGDRRGLGGVPDDGDTGDGAADSSGGVQS